MHVCVYVCLLVTVPALACSKLCKLMTKLFYARDSSNCIKVDSDVDCGSDASPDKATAACCLDLQCTLSLCACLRVCVCVCTLYAIAALQQA